MFITEADALKRVNVPGHRNVIRLVGCVLHQYPLMIVTERMHYGDLRSLLVNNRRNESRSNAALDLSQLRLMRFANDIAEGMAYLAEMRWVHGGMRPNHHSFTTHGPLFVSLITLGPSLLVYFSSLIMRRWKRSSIHACIVFRSGVSQLLSWS
jgi:hypothetical protein